MTHSRMVADWYSDLFNTIHEAGGDIHQDLWDVADHGLSDGNHQVDFDGKKWNVVGDDGEDEEATQYAKVHAPLGGITIMGRPFRGGQFIPAGVIKKMSQSDKNVLFTKLAQQRGLDPASIQAALGKSSDKETDLQSRHKNLRKMYEAMKKSHGGDLDKALSVQGEEAGQHANHPEHGKKIRAKLKDMGDMAKMGQEGIAGGSKGGASGGAAVRGQEGVVQPQIVVTQAADGYEAKFGEFAAAGQTPEEAVGILMKEHGGDFGMPVKQYQRQPQYSDARQENHIHIHIPEKLIQLPENLKLEIPAPNVVVNVPEQAAPQVNVAAAEIKVDVAAPTVNVAAADVKVLVPSPIVNVSLPMPVATEKEVVEWADAEKTIPKKIREVPVEK